MKKIAFLLSLMIAFSVANAQFPSPYCAELYGTDAYPITLVKFAHINQATSASLGTIEHKDYLVDTGYVFPGGSYDISLRGNSNGAGTMFFTVYIDWNGNDNFTDAGETFNIGSLTNTTGSDQTLNGTIAIPANVSNGFRRMRVVMKRSGFQAAPCNTTGIGQAQDYILQIYDFTPAYCNTRAQPDVEPITRVKFSNINHSSNQILNSNCDHEDFLNNIAFVQPGSSYNLTVQGNTNGNKIDVITAYIDWNNDGDFADANETVNVGNISNSTGLDAIQATVSITVPAATPLGSKRMRIMKRFGATGAVCAVTGSGQAEDYTVKVFSLSPYCTESYQSGIEPITSVKMSGLDNTSSNIINGTPDNEDFTALSAVVQGGNFSFPITVKGNTNGNFTDYIRVFIDWNNDHDFLDAGESYDIGTITNSTGSSTATGVTGNITVPSRIALGPRRMRVTKKRGGYQSSCNLTSFGQSEDYTITVINNFSSFVAGGNNYLKGNFVEVGINQCGTYGTTGVAPSSYHARSGINIAAQGDNLLNLGFVADPDKDGWTVGAPDLFHGDYFMPAAPFIGWGLSYNGLNFGTDRLNSSTNGCGTLGGLIPIAGSNISSTYLAGKAVGTWQSLIGTGPLQIQKITTVKQDKVYFTQKIKIYNRSATAIPNIFYGEYINPDNDAYFNNTLDQNRLDTKNEIIDQGPGDGQALVVANGQLTPATYLGLGSKDCRAKVFRGTFAGTPPSGSVQQWFLGSTGNTTLVKGIDATADNRPFGIAFNVGTLAEGDSTSFIYTYILKAEDFNEALFETGPTIGYLDQTVAPGGTVTPCANSTQTLRIQEGDFYDWTWSPATGLNTTTGSEVQVAVGTTPVTYTVSGTSAGCLAQNFTVTLDPVNIANVVTSPAAISKCSLDDAVQLTATGGTFSNATIISENFNSFQNSWTTESSSTGGVPSNAAFTLRSDGYIYTPLATTFHSNDNSQFYLTNSNAQGAGTTSTVLKSPAFSTIGYSSTNISFFHHFRETASLSTGKVEASLDGTAWTTLQTFTATAGSSTGFVNANVALTAPFLDQPIVYIRFKYDAAVRFYWAIDNVKITGSGQPLVWSPVDGLYLDAAATIPYNGESVSTVYASPDITTDYTATSGNGLCSRSGASRITVLPLPTVPGGATGPAVCQSKAVNAGRTAYFDNACGLLATIQPSGAVPVSGAVNTCVTLNSMAGPLPTFNAEPYLTRHFDIEPTTNAVTATATVTLYITQAEFDNYNLKNSAWPDLPTDPDDVVGISNLRITQYHGTPLTTPSLPHQYTGGNDAEYINPDDANITWNGDFWEVTFDATGFSGFYVHSNLFTALPVTINYFKGIKQGANNLLSWKVDCGNGPAGTLQLERSLDGRNFTSINVHITSPVECANEFIYTDTGVGNTTYYYRLKSIAADGRSVTSDQVILSRANSGNVLSVVPNPVEKDGAFHLIFNAARAGKMEIKISDITGRVVYTKAIIIAFGQNVVPLNVAQLASGAYYLVGYSGSEKTKAVGFIKQ